MKAPTKRRLNSSFVLFLVEPTATATATTQRRLKLARRSPELFAAKQTTATTTTIASIQRPFRLQLALLESQHKCRA